MHIALRFDALKDILFEIYIHHICVGVVRYVGAKLDGE